MCKVRVLSHQLTSRVVTCLRQNWNNRANHWWFKDKTSKCWELYCMNYLQKEVCTKVHDTAIPHHNIITLVNHSSGADSWCKAQATIQQFSCKQGGCGQCTSHMDTKFPRWRHERPWQTCVKKFIHPHTLFDTVDSWSKWWEPYCGYELSPQCNNTRMRMCNVCHNDQIVKPCAGDGLNHLQGSICQKLNFYRRPCSWKLQKRPKTFRTLIHVNNVLHVYGLDWSHHWIISMTSLQKFSDQSLTPVEETQ